MATQDVDVPILTFDEPEVDIDVPDVPDVAVPKIDFSNVKSGSSSLSHPIVKEPISSQTSFNPRIPNNNLSDDPTPDILTRVLSSDLFQGAAQPETLSDISNLLIPAGVEQAVGMIGKGIKNFRINPTVRRLDSLVKSDKINSPKLDLPDELPVIKTPVEAVAPPVATVANTTPVVSPTNPVVEKLRIAIEDMKPLNEQQRAIYTAERAKRIAAVKGVTTPGEAGFHKQLSELKGEMGKVKFTPIKLDQTDVDDLFDVISNHPAAIGFSEINAKTGLAKLLSGSVPQPSEVKLLEKVFGPETVASLSKRHGAKTLLYEGVNLPKSLMASYDLSAPFRQGIGLIHKKEFWTSFDDMFKSLGSENAFNGVQESIEQSRHFKLSQDAGLALTDLGSLTTREEQFMSGWAEKIPIIGRGVRASNRAYVGFLNKLRSDTFNNLIDQGESISKSMLKTAKNESQIQAAKLANPKDNLVLAEELANFVNTASGRGSLGKLEQSAVFLNSMLFSPRLIASRVKMLNPMTYTQASSQVRKEYLQSLFAIATAGTTIGQLAKLAGAEVSDEPTSADLGKIKIGNTRMDTHGGFQQYIVAANRLLTGEQTSSTSGNTYELGSKYGLPTRLDVLQNFGANKLAPVPKFAYDLLNANKHQPFHFTESAANLFIPMVIQDIEELRKEDPKLIPLAIPAAFGVGVQTYQ